MVGVEAGAAGLARWPRQQARVIHAAPVRGQLTQFAGKLIWAPWGQLKGCVGDGLRGHATPSQGHLCAFAVAKAHAGLPPPARYSTRSRALARPRPPAPRPPHPRACPPGGAPGAPGTRPLRPNCSPKLAAPQRCGSGVLWQRVAP